MNQKIIIKHIEEEETNSTLGRLYDAIESLEKAKAYLRDSKYVDTIEEMVSDIDKTIYRNHCQLVENEELWKSCVGKYFKVRKDNEENIHIVMFVYDVLRSNKTVFTQIVDSNSHHEGVYQYNMSINYDTTDWELEEITQEEFLDFAYEQDRRVILYNLQKIDAKCKTKFTEKERTLAKDNIKKILYHEGN